MKFFTILLLFLLMIGASFLLYQKAIHMAAYEGLPTVPCIDTTQPIRQSFSFSLTIFILGKEKKLDPTIGHDNGNCLHDIFVTDASGTIFVQANDAQHFTLGQFFDVWKKTFSDEQIFSWQKDSKHAILVTVNGKSVDNYRSLILAPNQNIRISYQ